jgi:hypothetical protein
MNHGHHDHSNHHHQEKPGRQFHKDWRLWLAVIAMLVALAVYVLTDNERLRPGPAQQPGEPVPAAP